MASNSGNKVYLTYEDMMSALNGSPPLESVNVASEISTARYDASAINKSIKRSGIDKKSLIEILCYRSNAEIEEIKEVYRKSYKDLKEDIDRVTSGDVNKFLQALVEAKRDESGSTDKKINDDADKLYYTRSNRSDTDVKSWITIMSERSVPHLQKVFEKYKNFSSYDIQTSIRVEVEGDLKEYYLILVQCVENKPQYFARRLHALMSTGVKEKVLTRIIVSQREVDLQKIKEEYDKAYKSLYESIEEMNFTEGDYQQALQKICN